MSQILNPAQAETLEEFRRVYTQDVSQRPQLWQALETTARKYYHQGNHREAAALQTLRLELAQAFHPGQIMAALRALVVSLGHLRTPESLRQIIHLTQTYLPQTEDLEERLFLCQGLLNGSISLQGINSSLDPIYQLYKQLIEEISQVYLQNHEDLAKFYQVISMGGLMLYFEDFPQENRTRQNALGSFGTQVIRSQFQAEVQRYEANLQARYQTLSSWKKRPLKVAYLTDCLTVHSVGWLVRWTLGYHNPDRVQVYTYSTLETLDPIHQRLIQTHGDRVRHIGPPIQAMIEQIQVDEIDILVDLGSLTEYQNCVINAVKPAPIHITWLGMDAPGIPTVDYYMGDRFSLPDQAQSYYAEKLIKMPDCYIAVDGFEIDRPSLGRQDFGIPEDSLIYLTSQGGSKRHPDHIKLQVQILAQVPHSYLLIKGWKTDEKAILNQFIALAKEFGVEQDRIKIMPNVEREEVHRANLTIADIILDTFPYNGATTTLEALWCEIPLVTKVGQQFAARNSYSMMINAGVTEGIAWSDQEYVDWGVKLGLNPTLRNQIRWKLHLGKRSSPIWNSRKFTQDLENVYCSIWLKYLEMKGIQHLPKILGVADT